MLAYVRFLCSFLSTRELTGADMFKKILVANRGELPWIIRACRELNIATAAIYSEADSTGIYVKKRTNPTWSAQVR